MKLFLNKSFVIFIIIAGILNSQSNHPYPPLDLVSIPTSGTMPRGSYTLETLLTKNGGFVPRLMIGLTNNLSIGMSFGIRKFIGEERAEKNKSTPEVQLKYRVFEETQSGPAFVIGLDTQGFGPFIDRGERSKLVYDQLTGQYNEIIVVDEVRRYEQKAWGVYAVFSKNWAALGNLGLHLGMNKNTFETKDNDSSLNFFFGIDKELNRSFAFLVEYNAALNDGNLYSASAPDLNGLEIGKGDGYLNAGMRWSVASNLLLEINFKDINLDKDDYSNREIKIMYSEQF